MIPPSPADLEGLRAPRSHRPARARALLCAISLAVLLALAPRAATAHANLDRAEPAPDATLAVAPTTVRIWFTEPVAGNVSGIEVLDTTGRRVDRNDSRVDLADPRLLTVGLLALSDGTYTVAWRNTSTVDGHPLRGTYAFAVGSVSGGPGGTAAAGSAEAVSDVSPLDPIVRWLVLGGLLVALGAEAFALGVLAPVAALRVAREGDLILDRRIVPAAMAIALLASVGHVALQATQGADPLAVVGGTRWGQLWAARVLLIIVALILGWRRRDPSRGMTSAAILVLLAAAAATLSIASHAAALPGLEVTAIANDLVHTIAAAVWAGGLVALLATARRVRTLPEAQRRTVLAEITRRFSPLALIVTAALLVTGVYAAWLQVAAWAALRTPYGWAVIAKVAAYLALIAVAAVNLLWVTRRLRAARGATRTLTVTVTVEVTLIAAALLAAGFLTGLEPARGAAGRGSREAETASGSVHLRVAVAPGTIGVNRIEVRVDDRGRPLAATGSAVTLVLQFTGADLGPREVPLRRDAAGTYVADRVVLSLEGEWQFQVGVTNPGSFDAEGAVRLPVTAAGTGGIPLPGRFGALLAAGWEVVILALVVLVVSEAFWKGSRLGHRANWAGTALVITGIMMVYGVGHAHQAATQVGGRTNPVLPSEASIAAGGALFQQHCVACHGVRGLGDGPEAAKLQPPPASLPLHVPLHSDGDVFAFIDGGFPGTAMPAFRGALTEEQMWHLVNYLRTLKPVPAGPTPTPLPTQ